ncbi:MAG: DUF2784 domain-containing protein [Pirellulaceae bacterium]|nr:DUF2784 domain-containing protein [Pirellulaceae bacterium]
MFYRRLADLVVVFHLLVALFNLVGAVLVMVQPWIALVHLPLAIWVCAAHLVGWTCPLTPLEKHLRELAGRQGYPGSFVDHYLWPLFAPSVASKNSRKTAIAIGIVLGTMQLLLYGFMVVNLMDDYFRPPDAWQPGPVPALPIPSALPKS